MVPPKCSHIAPTNIHGVMLHVISILFAVRAYLKRPATDSAAAAHIQHVFDTKSETEPNSGAH